MSFGVSVGDLLTISKLLKSTISSIRASRNAGTQYSDLVLSEIGALERVLRDIQDDEAITASDSVCIAAARCKRIIDEFLLTLKKYQCLGESGNDDDDDEWAGRAVKRTQKLFRASKKMQWGFLMERDIDDFRRRLAPTVMCLQVALTTSQLRTTSPSARSRKHLAESIGENGKGKEIETDETHATTSADTVEIPNSSDQLLALFNSLAGSFDSRFQILEEITRATWTAQTEAQSYLSQFKASPPAPDPRFTWAQAPLRFEDTFGRVLPIPSEYNWSKIKAIMEDQLTHPSTSHDLMTTEYTVVPPSYLSTPLIEAVPLPPGTSLTMAILVRLYDTKWNHRCPRPGCKSRDFSRDEGCLLCTKCSCSFYLEKTDSPAPPISAANFDGLSMEIRCRAMELLRAERTRFKNVAICFRSESEAPIREYTNVIALRELERAIAGNPERAKTIVKVIAHALNLDISELALEAIEDLSSLGLDSITAVQICLRLEEELGMGLSLDWFLGSEREPFARLIKTSLEPYPP